MNTPQNTRPVTAFSTDFSDARQNAQRIALTTLAGLIIGTGFLVGVGVMFRDNRGFAMAGVYAAMAVLSAIALRILSPRDLPRKRITTAILLVIIAIIVALIISSTFIANVGISVAIAILVITILVTFSTLAPSTATRFVVAALLAAFLAFNINLIKVYWTEIPRMDLPIATTSAPIFVGILILLLIVLSARKFVHITLQVKLLVAIMVATMVPLVIISILNDRNTRRVVTDQINETLKVAANQTATDIDEFINNNSSAVLSEAQLPDFVTYLGLTVQQRFGSASGFSAYETLQTLSRKDRLYIISYALIDKSGLVLLDTNPISQGRNEAEMLYFNETIKNFRETISPIQYQGTGKNAHIYFSAPIVDPQRNLLGLLRVQYDAEILMHMLNRNMGMVSTGSYPILFDDYQVRLADPITPRDMGKSIIPWTEDRVRFQQSMKRLPSGDPRDVTNDHAKLYQYLIDTKSEVISGDVLDSKINYAGAIASLRSMPWQVVYLQDTSVIFAPIEREARTALNIASLIAVLAAIGGLVLSQVLAKPIITLTQTARQISEGDLLAQADVHTNDEIETLAQSFNAMTGQLRSLITGLEERVQLRTEELSKQAQRMTYRATQLQTLGDVARAITSVQDLEELLTSVARLTSQRFNFYHVGIFLVDANNEYAVLRATNSEGGARMLARQHRLKVGQVGMVGYATGTGKPRIATDVGDDAIFFNNPDLPLTRSEMTLPLKRGAEVIGALDVQSTDSGAFTEEDIALFATLADQIAIAIVNNQLYAETRQALSDAQEVHRRYLRQAWDSEAAERHSFSYQYSVRGVEEVPLTVTDEIKAALLSGEVCTSTAGESSGGQTGMAVPITLRGEVIGVIDVQQAAGERWSNEEVALAQSVADQIAVALENARLFEQTVRRAEREKKALEITNKIRSTNDPQVMMQTAISELQQALRASRAQIVVQSEKPAAGHNGNGNGHKSGEFIP